MRSPFSRHQLSRPEALLFVAPALVLPLLYGGILAKRSGHSQAPAQSATAPPLHNARPAGGQDGPVVALAFSPDGQMLASSSGGIGIWEATGAVKLWSVRGTTLKLARQIPDRPFL